MRKPFIKRLKNKIRRTYRHPIRVFVFHQVSDVFEPDTMWDCDWTSTDSFKRSILTLKKKYTFISLCEAKEHLAKDWFRLRNFAVLTSDDGWASLKNIVPWLAENKIPITLFLNPSCLDGKHWNSRETDKLLSEDDVRRMVEEYAPFISIASHGWTHKSCTTMSKEEFEDNVQKSEGLLERLPGKVPFYAFASGRHTPWQCTYLRNNGLVPVFVDGIVNENDPGSIHRFCIDGIYVNGNSKNY